MARRNDKAVFNILIESVEPENSFFQTFWSAQPHPGAAIESVLNACRRLKINNAIARELDLVEFSSLPKDIVRDKKLNVSYSRERYYFPTEKSFVAPFGIIASREKGEYEYELIREGFYSGKTESAMYEIEVAIEGEKLFATFIELMRRLPSIRVFWIRIAADWESDGREEFWANERLNTEQSIRNFLTKHHKDTVANGHVALTAYSEVGQTNLVIGTHKTIKVLSKSARIQRMMLAALASLGYQELRRFYSLEYGYHHWHCRPRRSKSRKRLVVALKKSGFRLWKQELVQT